ncbi:carbohydrate esterase family 4 protein [Lactarius hengduanensis]|nr:carbohydrate esterase family 4 protein [Lactarius hengduanensis]
MLFKFSLVAMISSGLLVCASATAANITERASLAQVITSCVKPKTAALTFDDGPYLYIYDISKQLIAAGAKGTFFWNGNNYRCIYDPESVKRVKYIYDNGHMVASHTWAHKDLATLTFDQIHDEMWRVEQALQRILGVTPAFMRPLLAATTISSAKCRSSCGQKMVTWDFDSGDSTGSTAAQSNAAYDALVAKHPSNVLTINHEVYEHTAHVVVPHAIKTLQAAGYSSSLSLNAWASSRTGLVDMLVDSSELLHVVN